MISAGTSSTSIVASCWKYVHCVTSVPSSQTSQPSPQAPIVGASQLSSTRRISCLARSTPMASSEPQYWSSTSSGAGLRITWYCQNCWNRNGFSP